MLKEDNRDLRKPNPRKKRDKRKARRQRLHDRQYPKNKYLRKS